MKPVLAWASEPQWPPSVRCVDGVSDTLGVRHQSVRASGGEDHAHPLAPCHAGAARRGCCGRPLPPIQRTRRESVSSRRRSGRCLRSPTSGHLARVDQRTAAPACVAARLGGSRCLSDGPVRRSGAGKPLGRSVMSHAPRADRLLIKPTAGARPASPCTPGRFIPKARKRGLTPEESRTTRRPPSLATAPDGPTNRVSQTPEAVAFSASRRGLGWSRWGGG